MFGALRNLAAIVGVGFCVFLWQNPSQTGSVFEQILDWKQEFQEWSEAVEETRELGRDGGSDSTS
ncbi:MAG: hypothetical protein WA919_21870 [Coleofasciculaceae cyanobacterium]